MLHLDFTIFQDCYCLWRHWFSAQTLSDYGPLNQRVIFQYFLFPYKDISQKSTSSETFTACFFSDQSLVIFGSRANSLGHFDQTRKSHSIGAFLLHLFVYRGFIKCIDSAGVLKNRRLIESTSIC